MTDRMPTLELFELGLDPTPHHESYSPFCLKVHRALKAAELPYTRTALAMPGKVKPLNAAGQVPVLRVDGEVVTDSTRIVARLDRIAGGMFTPRDAALAAEARLWEDWADTALNGFVVAARWADEDNWPRVRAAFFGGMPAPLRAVLPEVIRRGPLKALHARDITRGGMAAMRERFAQTLDDLEALAPAQGFLVGGELTAADLAIFGQLHSLRDALTPGQRDAIAQRPALSAWLDRVDLATTAPKARA